MNWSEIGKSYIYHIEIKGCIYVGQSKAEKPGSRLKYRLTAPFGLKKADDSGSISWSDSYDVPELAELIRKYGLKDAKIRYFNDSNYGIPDGLMKAFKKTFKPSKEGKEEISNLDAAEILHILYFVLKGKYKVLNTEMGGTDGSLNIIENGEIHTKVLTRKTSPQAAAQIFLSKKNTRQAMSEIRDLFNSVVFTKEWNSFYARAVRNKGKRLNQERWTKIQNNKYASKDYEWLINGIANTILNQSGLFQNYKSLEKNINTLVTLWANGKQEVFYAYLGDYLNDHDNMPDISTRGNELIHKWLNSPDIKALCDYISESILHMISNSVIKQIRESFLKNKGGEVSQIRGDKLKKEFNKFKSENWMSALKNRVTELKDKEDKTFKIVSPGALFTLKGITHQQAPWWYEEFNQWDPASTGQSLGDEAKKEVAFNVFCKIAKQKMQENYYNNSGIYVSQFNDEYAFVTSKGKLQSLSSKIHEVYQDLGLDFVENQWREFYSKMISLMINRGDPWQFDYNIVMGPVAYRPSVTVTVSYATKFNYTSNGEQMDSPEDQGSMEVAVGHRINKPNAWGAISLNDLLIY